MPKTPERPFITWRMEAMNPRYRYRLSLYIDDVERWAIQFVASSPENARARAERIRSRFDRPKTAFVVQERELVSCIRPLSSMTEEVAGCKQ